MMLRFIGTLCVGTLLLMGVGLWFGSKAVSPELSGALRDVRSQSVEALRSVAALAPKLRAAVDAPDPVPSLAPQAPPREALSEDLASRETKRRAAPGRLAMVETLPDWSAPFLESKPVETAGAPDSAPSQPDPEAWAGRIRRMLAIYARVGEER